MTMKAKQHRRRKTNRKWKTLQRMRTGDWNFLASFLGLFSKLSSEWHISLTISFGKWKFFNCQFVYVIENVMEMSLLESKIITINLSFITFYIIFRVGIIHIKTTLHLNKTVSIWTAFIVCLKTMKMTESSYVSLFGFSCLRFDKHSLNKWILLQMLLIFLSPTLFPSPSLCYYSSKTWQTWNRHMTSKVNDDSKSHVSSFESFWDLKVFDWNLGSSFFYNFCSYAFVEMTTGTR